MGDSIIDSARGCVAEAAGARPAALGIGVAGQVNARTGEVLFAPNLG
ncbi:MAG: hypothetical protein HY703_13510 [Gemmatimonadetes bacterium]|nr:hypothetical protein [Gemmatimonadota bacterium]